MHELSIATALLEEVENVRRRENGRRVVSVTVAVGELSGVEREAFEFCFPLAAEGTAAENAVLIIENMPLIIRCSDCNHQGRADIHDFKCSVCGSYAFQIMAGRELTLTSMEIE